MKKSHVSRGLYLKYLIVETHCGHLVSSVLLRFESNLLGILIADLVLQTRMTMMMMMMMTTTTTMTMTMTMTMMKMMMTLAVRRKAARDPAGDDVVGRDTVPMTGTRARRTTQTTPIAATTTGGLTMVI